MNQKKQSILIIALFVLNIVNYGLGSPQLSQEAEPQAIHTTGITIPKIDGFVDKASPPSFVNEWGDGLREMVSFQGIDGQSVDNVEMLIKVVGSKLYVAFIYPVEIQEIVVKVDVNGDSEISDGDALVKISHANDIRSFVSQNLKTELFIHQHDDWIDIQSYNPELFQRDDELIYADLVSKIVGVGSRNWDPTDRSTGEWNPTQEVELFFNPTEFKETLGVSREEPVGNVGEISFTIQITDTNQGIFGYPSAPERSTTSEEYIIQDYKHYDYFRDGFSLDNFGINVGVQKIEVTQSVQTINNDLSLVRGKQTMARVYVTGGTDSVDVEVNLYAYLVGYLELVEIGMMSKEFTYVPFTARQSLSASANFILPDDWVSNNYLILKAVVNPIDKIDSNYANNELIDNWLLKKTKDMNIYYVRINSGTASDPNQVSTSWVDQAKAGFTAMYPMANPNFIELGWEVLGENFVVGSEALKSALNELASNLILTSLFMILLGLEPLPIPDQVFGFRTSGAGSSSPAWAGYSLNYGSWGGLGATVGPLVLSHEINHNLGDNNWGRHVGDNEINDPDWGCDAAGTDQAWPKTVDDINAVHSTTLGWNPATGLVPANKPDIMSYCRDTSSSLWRWISDYRWEHWVNKLLESSSSSLTALDYSINTAENHQSIQNLEDGLIKPDFTLPSVRVISGFIYPDGTANFNPSYTDPGVWEESYSLPESVNQTHTVVVYYSNGTKTELPLHVEFSDNYLEGNHPIPDSRYFSFWVPDTGNITSFELYDAAGNLLAQQRSTEFGVSGDLSVQSSIIRNETILFDTAFQIDGNSTTVYSQLQYAHDGYRWTNLGPQTKGFLPAVQINGQPGGLETQFRIRFTDGFFTYYLYASNNASVPDLPPTISFHRNSHLFIPEVDDEVLIGFQQEMQTGSFLSLHASSYDPETGVLPGENISFDIFNSDGSNIFSSTGNDFKFYFRNPGEYRIVVTSYDRNQNQVSSDILVSIVAPMYLPEETLDAFKNAMLEQLRTSDQPMEDEEETPNPSLPFSQLNVFFALILLPIIKKVKLKRKSN